MTDDQRNITINDYISINFSPREEQRDYIKAKYGELRTFLNRNCFRTGSYARYTAIHPVHDLDVIYVLGPDAYDDPAGLMRQLKYDLEHSGITNIKKVTAQTHSVTVTFTDSVLPFGIDVVPAIETNEYNEFGTPLYVVPEILQINHEHRQQRYAHQALQPVSWVKSDPSGYVKASKAMNDSNANFRHATKLAKAWRHASKEAYGDDFKLKSFHLEMIFFDHFTSSPSATTTEAFIDCMGELPNAIDSPQFLDRADSAKFIDQYVEDLTDRQKQLIRRLQADAYAIASKLAAVSTAEELGTLLASLAAITKSTPSATAGAGAVSTPRQPWAF